MDLPGFASRIGCSETLPVDVQQLLDVGIAFAAVAAYAQAFEQFAARTHALVNGKLYLGIRHCLTNAYVHQ